MGTNLSVQKTGIALGALMALWHAMWSLLVAIGMAQVLLDWIYALHFLNNPFVVDQFDFLRALFLVVVTGVIGYVMGSIFALLWNMFHKNS